MKKLLIVLMMTGAFLMGSLITVPPAAQAGWYDSQGRYHKGNRPKRHHKPVHRHHKPVKKYKKHHKPHHAPQHQAAHVS